MIKRGVDIAVQLLHKCRPAWYDHEKRLGSPAQRNYRYELPQNMTGLPTTLQAEFRAIAASQASLPERHVYRLSSVNVSWHGVVFRDFRIFLPSLIHDSVLPQYTNSFLLKQWLGEAVDAPSGSIVAVVHNQFSAINYFHWLIEALPRLLLVKTAEPESYLLVPAPVPEFISVTARLLGFTKLLLLQRNQVLRNTTVLLPEATHVDGHQDPVLMRQVRQQLVAGSGYVEQPPTRRIYVSRSRQRMRKLMNEAALDELLAAYNFEKVYFEELTFEQQLKISLEASVLMGVHGANLTNMLFMQPGTQLIELMNQHSPNLVYFRMASYLDVAYYNVPCQTAEGEENTNNSNLTVELAYLKRLLGEVLK
jgi:hypothetical protein